MKIRCLSMWQPWCYFVRLNWKIIETRTHNRFHGLIGHRIGIHAAQKWDDDWERLASPWMSVEQIMETRDMERTPGHVICMVDVDYTRPLDIDDGPCALIECETKRFGLFFTNCRPLRRPFKVSGKQGIFYAEIQ